MSEAIPMDMPEVCRSCLKSDVCGRIAGCAQIFSSANDFVQGVAQAFDGSFTVECKITCSAWYASQPGARPTVMREVKENA